MKKDHFIYLSVIISVISMSYIDTIVQPGYLIRSIIKIFLFCGTVFLYSFVYKHNILDNINFNLSSLKKIFPLALGVYILILAAFFIFRNVFDFSHVKESLLSSVKVSKDNFIFVSIYISLFNSFLEEFFFRGYCFLHLKTIVSRKRAYIFSSLIFALYHCSMMIGWFNIILYLLLIVSLFVAGLIFNYLNERFDSLFASWFFHMFANLSINTVGIILLF
ncbi:MAG: CPBP family intramembrane glutamic endopeptidase [Erysipelotrichaceae bacterium]|mgnify:CR=1 FL=1|jgi:membrane protease YdiL (CAAX protease family)|nr:CPBP family intramembrane metalloprotease [Erysipelotrichia bacterium]